MTTRKDRELAVQLHFAALIRRGIPYPRERFDRWIAGGELEEADDLETISDIGRCGLLANAYALGREHAIEFLETRAPKGAAAALDELKKWGRR